MLSELEQENSDIVRGGINSSFTEFEAIIGVLADIGSSPQATVLFGEYLEGFAPETDLATANGLPIQEAAAVANLWINQGGFDEVSRSAPPDPATVLFTLAAAGRNPADITLPTAGARNRWRGRRRGRGRRHVWLGEFVDNHDECHREFDNSVPPAPAASPTLSPRTTHRQPRAVMKVRRCEPRLPKVSSPVS